LSDAPQRDRSLDKDAPLSAHARRQGYRITIDEHGSGARKQCLPSHLFEAGLQTASSVGDVGYFRFTNKDLGGIFNLTFRRHQRRTGRQFSGKCTEQ
jgi:hypothetical protein